jgi:hypothetical protein
MGFPLKEKYDFPDEIKLASVGSTGQDMIIVMIE